MFSPTLATLALIFALAPPAVVADSPVHAAHTHGTATLNVAIEGETLVVELASPAANLLGFEHAARNADERRRLEQTAVTLRNAAVLFTPSPAAGCVAEPAEIEAALLDEHGQGEPADGHSDFYARYRFHCARPAQLAYLEVQLFERFPGIEVLEARYVTAQRQGRALLQAASPRLAL